MFSIVPLTPRGREYGPTRHHPSVQKDVDMYMDLDDDLDHGSRITSPGETISSSSAVLRGHGTYVEGEGVIASVTGVITRVNKLVTVRAVKSRYSPEVGDLVVGRIVEVAQSRWKVDVNGRQDAVLHLASVNLPGGIQRRKLETDELQMRNFFEEGDLLVAEVQAAGGGNASLHTRSLKFGKLRNGQLATVPPALVRRLKSQFHSLPCGVDLILGMNGYIWVSKHVKESEQLGEEGFDAEGVYSNVNDDIDNATRAAISRVSNIILVLAGHHVPLTDMILNNAYDWVLEQGISTADILLGETGESMVLSVTAQLQ